MGVEVGVGFVGTASILAVGFVVGIGRREVGATVSTGLLDVGAGSGASIKTVVGIGVGNGPQVKFLSPLALKGTAVLFVTP